MDELRDKIEKTRQEIYRLSQDKGINSREVLEMSQKLDQLINENVNILRTNSKKRKDNHVRIMPTGNGYSVTLQKGLNSVLVGFAEDFDAAKKMAFIAAKTKRANLDVLYLEQKLEEK